MRKEWSAMKKLIWLKRAVLSAASAILKTITGLAPLLLGNALAMPIHSLTQYGKCTQSGTPTPSAPVDIVCNNGALKYSANMANVNEQTAMVGYYINAQGQVLADIYNWFYQSFIPVRPNTTYTLAMSQPVYYVTISEYSTAEDSGFIIRKAGQTGGNTSLTITTGANTNFIRFGTNLNRVVVTMEMVLAINWMLNLGGTAMDYQPYVEGGVYAGGTPEVLTVSGANLLDPSESNIVIGEIFLPGGEQVSSRNNWRTGFIPIEGGKTYAFWGRKKSDNTISAYNRINWFDADGNNISPRPSYTVDTVTVGTAPSNAVFAGLSCSPYNSSAAITRDTFDEYNWMFAEAAQEIPYEPYVTPQTVGWKNLFDASSYTEINAYVNANTGVLTAGSPGSMTQYCAVIPCEPNTQYNITGQGTSAWGAFTSDSIGTTATATTKGGNLTTGADDRYLIGLVRANGDSIDYRNTLVVQETVTDIPMLLGVGDYKDEAELISGIKTGKVGIKVLDGTENWNAYQVSSGTAFIQNATSAWGAVAGAGGYCTHLTVLQAGETTFAGSCRFATDFNIYEYKTAFGVADVAGFKAKLAAQYATGTPVIVLYPLATETTEQLTAQHLHTNDGTNIVDVTSNVDPVELKAEYYATE